MMLSIGISTMANNLEESLLLANEIINSDCNNFISEVVILSQGESEESSKKITKKISLLKSQNRGLSLSRNTLINHLSSDYVWLVDDDISINFECIDKVESVLSSNNDIDILIGRIKCSDIPCEDYKDYSRRRNGILGLLRVSSIELITRREFVTENGITYDESLGLGAKYPCGEENNFLLDCWSASARVKFVEDYIVYHPCIEKSNNKNGYFDTNEQIMSKLFLLDKLPFPYNAAYFLKLVFHVIFSVKDYKKLKYIILNSFRSR